MFRVLVAIKLSDDGIQILKTTPELPKKEMEFVNRWKEEKILESFYISVSLKEAVLIFKDIDETKCRELIATLPYYPYMAKVDYLLLNKQF